MNRLLHIRHTGLICNRRATIINTISDHWPPIIGSFFNNIKLISTPRAMLMCPHFFSYRMVNKSLRVSVSIGINSCFSAFYPYKWIVRRNTSVCVYSIDFSTIPFNILWVNISISAFSNGKI